MSYSKMIYEVEHLFNDIYEQMPICVNLLDSKYNILMCNTKCSEFFGFDKKENYKKKFYKLFLGVDQNDENSIKAYQTKFDKLDELKSVSFDMERLDILGTRLPLKIKLIRSNIMSENNQPLFIEFIELKDQGYNFEIEKNNYYKKLMGIVDASPLCCNLWNSNFENLLCNQKAVDLFKLDSKEQFINEFARLSPKYQPNGELSSTLAITYIKKAFETGFHQFKWLHCTLDGEQIPSEITLKKINGLHKEEINLVAGFTRDIRIHLAGNYDHSIKELDGYFQNLVPIKTLFNTITDLSNELFFSIDKITSSIQYFGNLSKIGLTDKNDELFPIDLIKRNIIDKKDIHLFNEFLGSVEGKKEGFFEFKYKGLADKKCFYRLIYRVIYSNSNKINYIIGKIADVSELKDFEIKSKFDLLTNCYNKITLENEITKSINNINSNLISALFIIDVDNFKAVNDNYGHYCGDMVLIDIAAKIKTYFMDLGIVGRIGGDEFLGFALNISIEQMNQLIDTIMNGFNDSYQAETTDFNITLSLGISRFGIDGNNYIDLYKNADIALYKSKKQGKNSYTIYNA